MTDAPGLTPEQDAVRRLLADARHAGATPPEVVARLDDTLASLVAERGGHPLPGDGRPDTPAPVVDLGARRRRTVGLGLLAAAAVVVAGIAVGQGLPGTSGGQSDSASTAGGADTATGQERSLSDDNGMDSGAGSAEAPESLKSAGGAPQDAVPRVSASDGDLDQELLGLRSQASARRGYDPSVASDAFCLRGIGPGRRLAAEVDGRPGVIVYRPRSGDAQEVAVFVCGDGEPVRTLFLPLP